MGITSVSNKVGRVEKEEEAENSVTVDILKYLRIFEDVLDQNVFSKNIFVKMVCNTDSLGWTIKFSPPTTS